MPLFSRFTQAHATNDADAVSSPPAYAEDSKHVDANSEKSGAGDDSSVQVLTAGAELTYEEGEYRYLQS